MTWWHSLEFWRSAALLSTAVGQTSFVLFYSTLPWWRTFMGKALFLKSLALMLLVDVAIAGRLFDWRYEDFTYIVLYGGVAVGVWAQLLAFVRNSRATQSDNREMPVNQEGKRRWGRT